MDRQDKSIDPIFFLNEDIHFLCWFNLWLFGFDGDYINLVKITQCKHIEENILNGEESVQQVVMAVIFAHT